MKKVRFSAKPENQLIRDPDAWVTGQSTGEATKRLTIDVSLDLHKRIKGQCASQGVNMADAIRKTLEERFPRE